VVHIHKEYYSAMKTTWMELKIIMLKVKDKYYMISVMWRMKRLISKELRVKWWLQEAGAVRQRERD
jgi:hypothetical protein